MSEVDKYKNKKVIWYIHPYSGGPGIGPSFRPYDFCKEFTKRDIFPIIIIIRIIFRIYPIIIAQIR